MVMSNGSLRSDVSDPTPELPLPLAMLNLVPAGPGTGEFGGSLSRPGCEFGEELRTGVLGGTLRKPDWRFGS